MKLGHIRHVPYLAILVLAAACGSNAPTGPSDSATPSGSTLATSADLQFCVDETNRYRAMIGRPMLTRSIELETFAAAGAKMDTDTGTPHRHFSTVAGPATAENEAEGFPATAGAQAAIRGALQLFWSEGPGGGHYDNMANARATAVGCGLYATGGAVTVVQDFR